MTKLQLQTAQALAPSDAPGFEDFLKERRAAWGASHSSVAKSITEGTPETDSPDPVTCPIDLEVGTPVAVDLRRLAGLLGRALPAGLEATLGGMAPVLVVHTITPFYEAGDRPPFVWGLGYAASLVGLAGSSTRAVFPNTQMLEVGAIRQTLSVGLGVGGSVGVPKTVSEAVSGGAVALHGASVSAGTEQGFSLDLRYTLQLLKIQAGALKDGGARWNLYHQDEALHDQQTLVQLVMVPESAQKLEIEIKVWVTVARLKGVFRKTWKVGGICREVSLEGLGG